MKKILALAAIAALAAGASAYAANPFSDVSTSDWAYQAVSDLSDQGLVEGYPDGTFKGEANITRYEMAQIIARLMAREDQYNAEQRATIDKLAGEYADELNSLGVRVADLEKKVGNISFTGDARMRYQDTGSSDNWDGRFRLNAKGQVNEDTTVNARFTYVMNYTNSERDSDGVYMDVLNATHTFGDAATVKLGRYGLTFGNQASWFYGSTDGIDGVEADFKLGSKVDVVAGYGQFNAGTLAGNSSDSELANKDVFYAKANGDLGFADLGVNYINFQDNLDAADGGYAPEIYGVNLTVPVGKARIFGEYWKNSTAPANDTAWNAGVGYGKLDLSHVGSFSLEAAYNDVDEEMYFTGASGTQTSMFNNVEGHGNVSFWNVLGDVAVAQNVYLHGEYAFGADAKTGTDPDDSWTLSLNYQF